MLALDKNFLTKQVEELKAKLELLEQKLARKSSRMRTLKQDREDLSRRVCSLVIYNILTLPKLASVQDEPKIQYETKLQAEIERLQRHLHAELADLRSQSQQSIFQETQSLREVLLCFFEAFSMRRHAIMLWLKPRSSGQNWRLPETDTIG